MRTFFEKIVFLMLLALLFACHGPQREAKPCPQEDVLYQLEGCCVRKPDSTLKVLDTLDISVLSEKERAHYCLLKARTRDALFFYDAETDSLSQVAKDYFIGGKDKYFEAMTYEALAHVGLKNGQGSQYRLDWRQKALQSIEQCQSVDKRLVRYNPKYATEQEFIDGIKHGLHWRLGMTYIQCGYKKDGIFHLQKAADYYLENQDEKMQCNAFYALADAYLSRKDYDSCMLYLQKGQEMAEKLGDKDLRVYYFLSMSKYYRYMYKDFDFENEGERENVMWQSIAECWKGLSLYEGSMFKYKDGFYSELSSAYGMLHQYDSCIYYAKKQLEFMERMHQEIVPNQENAGIYLRIYKSYESLGDAKNALPYADRYLMMQRMMANEPQAVAQVKSEYDKKLEVMQLQNEQQVKRYRLYLLLALMLLALMLVLWLTFRYRKNKEIETLKYQEAYRQLQSKLEQASQHSQQVLQQRAMNLYKTKVDKTWERILAEFEMAYPQATEKLKMAHPDLTETERNIVILSYLGFRTKEEAEILNLSLNTVEKYRTNIRKKAGFDPVFHLIR